MKIDIDFAAWQANPKIDAVFTTPKGVEPAEAETIVFNLPAFTNKVIVVVTDEGTKIDLQPERSASHRALRDALIS